MTIRKGLSVQLLVVARTAFENITSFLVLRTNKRFMVKKITPQLSVTSIFTRGHCDGTTNYGSVQVHI